MTPGKAEIYYFGWILLGIERGRKGISRRCYFRLAVRVETELYAVRYLVRFGRYFGNPQLRISKNLPKSPPFSNSCAYGRIISTGRKLIKHSQLAPIFELLAQQRVQQLISLGTTVNKCRPRRKRINDFSGPRPGCSEIAALRHADDFGETVHLHLCLTPRRRSIVS